MKFQCEAKDLLSALVAASQPIKKQNIPILECVCLIADDRLRLVGSSMDTEVAAECRASITDQGSWAVNAVDLRSFLTPLGDCLLTVSGDGFVTLSGAKAKVRLPAYDGVEFPSMEKAETPNEASNGLAALKYCAQFSAPPSEYRDYLKGVRFGIGGAVGAQETGMAIAASECLSEAILPAEAVRAVSDILKADGRLFFGPNAWRAECEGVVARGKVLVGEFPPFRKLIPEGPECLIVSADDLLSGINLVTLGRATRVILSASKGSISLRAEAFGGVDVQSSAEVDAEVFRPFVACFLKSAISTSLSANSGLNVSIFGGEKGVYGMSIVGRDDRTIILPTMLHVDSAVPE